MLPFLKQKPPTQGVVYRHPDETGPDIDGMRTCAYELIKAVHTHDVRGVIEALTSAFEILDSKPEEKEAAEESKESSIEPHSYDSQKGDK